MRPGLEHPAEAVAEAVEDVADGLAGRHLPGHSGTASNASRTARAVTRV